MQIHYSFLKKISVVLLLAGLYLLTHKENLDHYFGLRSILHNQVVFNEHDLLLEEMDQLPSIPGLPEFNEMPFDLQLEEQLQEQQLELEKE